MFPAILPVSRLDFVVYAAVVSDAPCFRRRPCFSRPQRCHRKTMATSAEAAAGKENVGSTTAKPVRRGVGPRSGTKKKSPLPRAPTTSGAAPDSSAQPRIAVAPPARRSTSRVKAHAPNSGGIGNAPPSRGAPAGAADKTGQQQKLCRSQPTMLPSASSVPLSDVSSTKGTSGGGAGGRGNKRGSAKRSGGGPTRQAKQRRGEVVVASKAAKKNFKAKEKGDKVGPRKPAGLTSAPPLRLSSQEQSGFEFDLTDDEIDGIDNRSESAHKARAPQRSEGTSRRKSSAAAAATARRKRGRDSDAGEKNAQAKHARKSSDRSERKNQEVVPTQEASLGPGRRTTSSARRSSAPATSAARSTAGSCSPRSTSGASSGGDGTLSPRGSWHLGALFGESDDDADADEGEGGEAGMCNWRLSDDEREDEVDLPKRKQRRSVGSGATSAAAAAAGGKKKKSRASSGGDGGGGSVGGRSGSKKPPTAGSGGGGGGDDAGEKGGDEAVKSGWADRLPPPASVDERSDSDGGSGSQNAGDEAVLEALKAQFKKVDSHQLNISR